MVLCHGRGGIPSQRSGRERGVGAVNGFVLGALLGSKNFTFVFLSTLSTMRYCHAIIMCVVAAYTNRAFTRSAFSNCAFVA